MTTRKTQVTIRACALVLLFLFTGMGAAKACDGRLIKGPDILGEPVCVPEKAERIVVLDPTFSLGMSLELDLPVVGAPLFGMSDKQLLAEARARSVEDLGAFTEPGIEKIVGLRPDLIIASAWLGPEAHAVASRIAPTVMITANDWKSYYRMIGEISGTIDKVEKALSEYEARAAKLRARMPDVRVSVVRITPWDFQVYLDGPDAYAPFAIMQDAGVKRSEYETRSGGPTVKRPDWEDLAALNGDILLYIVGGANNSDTNGRHDEVIGNPLWKMLPAVAAGKVHRVDAATWMEFSGIASAHRVLDDIERYIMAQK